MTTSMLPVSEAEWLATTCGMLDAGGWSWIHYDPTRRARTRFTEGSTGSSAAGWPDLFAVRGDRSVALELKREGNKPSAEQVRWLDRLRSTGIESFVVTLPHDYEWLTGLLREPPEQQQLALTSNSIGATWLPANERN